ncbi:hypothetical protein DM01DRAFT_1340425 [Hesseltinella vesiculosa]|uniref:Arrestin C-terminal-like domain-containing protein n=1 Tax=Hesseltinella vesiculosa TaxID=101127 RepID=A0A1X2G530_9FUNG|nr:hypothetical protein DM01DRAFT_1340425 [Hesseltinella vesiculosa]
MSVTSSSDVSLRVVLDQAGPFFPGDTIKGKILVTSQRPFRPHNLRLIWAGGSTIQPSPAEEHENHLFFRRSFALHRDHLQCKKSGQVYTYKPNGFVENYDTTEPLQIQLEANPSSYAFCFEVEVPNEDFPSCTTNEVGMFGGRISYSMEGFMDTVKDDPTPLRSFIEVNVLEYKDTMDAEFKKPYLAESVYFMWLDGTPKDRPNDYKTAIRATTNTIGIHRGGSLDLTIHIWHSTNFQRMSGVSVVLLRQRLMNYRGNTYAQADATVMTMRANVDLRQENKFVQTLNCTLDIPENITPTIGQNGHLLQVSYKVMIKAQLQDGTYQIPNSTHVQRFMSLEIPLTICTVPLMVDGRRINIPSRRRVQPAASVRHVKDEPKQRKNFWGRLTPNKPGRSPPTSQPGSSASLAQPISSSSSHHDGDSVHHHSGISGPGSPRPGDASPTRANSQAINFAQRVPTNQPSSASIIMSEGKAGLQPIRSTPMNGPVTKSPFDLKPDEVDDQRSVDSGPRPIRVQPVRPPQPTVVTTERLPMVTPPVPPPAVVPPPDQPAITTGPNVVSTATPDQKGVVFHDMFDDSDEDEEEYDDEATAYPDTTNTEATSPDHKADLAPHSPPQAPPPVPASPSPTTDTLTLSPPSPHLITTTASPLTFTKAGKGDRSLIKPTESEELQLSNHRSVPSQSLHHQHTQQRLGQPSIPQQQQPTPQSLNALMHQLNASPRYSSPSTPEPPEQDGHTDDESDESDEDAPLAILNRRFRGARVQ